MAPTLKLDPISADEYFTMDPMRLDKLMSHLSVKNRRWMNVMLPSTTTWVYLNSEGEVWGQGEGNVVPSTPQTREAASWIKQPLYLLMRSQSRYRDITFFMETSAVHDLEQRLQIPDNYFFPYIDKSTGITSVNAQSGTVNLLKDDYAMGSLKTQQPRDEATDTRFQHGATVADVRYVGWEHPHPILYIASQNMIAVHGRGRRVRGERPGEKSKIIRVERQHRFDDPILDIFDTYNFLQQDGWKPFILYGPRAVYDTHREEAFLPKHADLAPKQMELLKP